MFSILSDNFSLNSLSLWLIYSPSLSALEKLAVILSLTARRLHASLVVYPPLNPTSFTHSLFNSLYKFCFVRNPYDRLFSAYTFLKEGGINNQDLEFSNSYLQEFASFDEFVLKGLEKEEIMNWVHFKPQYTFVCDENDNIVMDFIGKMENLKADFNTVCKHLNIESELQELNMSSAKKNEFSEEVKAMIKLKYQKDFNLFYPHL